MPLVLFKDSFDRYDLGTVSGAIFDNFVSRYTTATSSGMDIVNDGPSGRAISLGIGVFSKTLPHGSTWTVGFRAKFSGTPIGENRLLQIFNCDAVLLTLLHDEDGTLSMRAGTSIAQAMGVTDRALLRDRWYYIELTLTLGGDISATAEVKINGHVEMAGTHATAYHATNLLSQDATANVFTFSNGMGSVGSGTTIADLYIINEALYEGDIRNVAAYPSGDGGTIDWTPDTGSVHYTEVNSHPADVSKFVKSGTVGQIDLWTITLPTITGSILAVNFSVLARKDDEGTKSFRIVIGPTGTDAASDEFFVSDVSPEYYEFSLKQDPTTGLDWASGDTITMGVELMS